MYIHVDGSATSSGGAHNSYIYTHIHVDGSAASSGGAHYSEQ